MTAAQTPDVSTPLPAYAVMAVRWVVIDALMGGTETMRLAGKVFLPKFELEEEEDWKARVKVATLYPAYSETVNYMTGRVFANPLTWSDKTPPELQQLFTNIDLQGRSLQDLAKEFFAIALAKGHCHILVDMPKKTNDVRTVADQKAKGIRPFARLIDPRQIIGWRCHYDNGAEILDQIRILEIEQVPDGQYNVKNIEQVRVIEPGKWEVWRLTTDTLQQSTWTLFDSGTMELSVIPLVTLYANRKGTLLSTPPMMELAYLNIKHWQSQSDQDNILHYARVPIFAVSGVDQVEVKLSAKSAIKLPTNGKAEWVEHKGYAISAGQKSLDALVEDMRQSGAKLLRPVITSLAAKQATSEAIKETSALGMLVQSLESCFVQIFDLMGKWLGIDASKAAIQTNADLEPDYAPDASAATLQLANEAGKLSDETFFGEMQRRGIIADDIKWGDELKRIQSQPNLAPLTPPKPKPGSGSPTPPAA